VQRIVTNISSPVKLCQQQYATLAAWQTKLPPRPGGGRAGNTAVRVRGWAVRWRGSRLAGDFTAAAPQTAAMLARAEQNMRFWMEHEFRQYPAYHPDLDALAAAGTIVPAGGRDSREHGNMPFLPVVTLARRLGRDVAEFPGGHVGYAEHPGDFAARLGRLLSAGQ
jgi:hypothetical protein